MRSLLIATSAALLLITEATTATAASTTTTLGSSLNPAVYGQSVTFTATVTSAGGTPTGTVNFKDGSTVIGSALPLDGSGVATFTTSSLTTATHTMTAVYSGASGFSASTSANLSQVVNKAGTTTALASSLNPVCAGQPVTLTATVSVVAPGVGVPTGNVNIKDGTTVIGSNVALDGSGVAMFTTSSLTAANHNLTAVFNGSANFSTSTSTPALVQTVKPKPTASVSGSTSICPGGSASVQAVLAGTGPWDVTWSDGVVQSGVAASPASRSVSPAATTVYSVTSVVDANCSNTGSGSATVTVNALPAISGQPSAKAVCAGGTATFTVVASGSGLTYQWRKDGVGLVNGGHVSGATSATLSISTAAAADAGSYDVVVSGACPPAQTSNAASLTINPVPDATISATNATLCAGTPGNTASVADAGAGATYAWTITNGTVTGGAGTSGITYTAGANGNSLTLNVTVTSAGGCSVSSSKVVGLSTGGVAIEDWKNIPVGSGGWQSATLQAKDMTYPEGGTVPYRLTLSQPCVGSTWSITIEWDFADLSSGVHFCDFLTSYNAYEGSVNQKGCLGDTCTGETNFPIPADPSLSYQLPGLFTVENGTITSVSAYTSYVTGGATVKQLTLTGTATPGADVMILFGAHLARDYEWGTNHGAHEWPTGTASIGFTGYSGAAGSGTSGHTNVKVSDNILNNPSQSDLAVVASDSPNPVNAGQDLTYSFIVSNSGPLSSIADTLSDSIPAGTRFVSASSPTGWTVMAPATGGSGVVRWVLASGFTAGASATFELVVAVDASATGTVENTVALTTGNIDAYQTNNSAHTSTAIGTAPAGSGGGPDSQMNPDGDGSPNEQPLLPRSGNRPGGGNSPGPNAGPTPVSSDSTASQSGHAGGSAVSGGAGSGVSANTEVLERPTPNPFTGSMHMAYAVTGEAERVEISVYDVAGRRVSVLADGVQPVGRHSVAWDGRDASGAQVRRGMYFVRVQIGNEDRQVRVASVK